jgi:hypothetical protein
LKHLQPSVVNTLHSGAGPLTVILPGTNTPPSRERD